MLQYIEALRINMLKSSSAQVFKLRMEKGVNGSGMDGKRVEMASEEDGMKVVLKADR